jgi:hypothetical protein
LPSTHCKSTGCAGLPPTTSLPAVQVIQPRQVYRLRRPATHQACHPPQVYRPYKCHPPQVYRPCGFAIHHHKSTGRTGLPFTTKSLHVLVKDF